MRLIINDRSMWSSHISIYRVKNPSATVEHEATTSKIGEDQLLFYCMQRGISEEKAIGLIVNGYC